MDQHTDDEAGCTMQAGAIRASNEGAMGQLIQASLKAGGLNVDGDDMTEAVAYMQQVRDRVLCPWCLQSLKFLQCCY